MIIRSYKNSEKPKIDHKVSETELFKLFETSDGDLLKKYKIGTIYYRNLLLFHQKESYYQYLVELANNYDSQDVVSIPLEVYSSQGFVQEIVQKKLESYMSLDKLAPKTNLELFITSLNVFMAYLSKIEGLDLTHVRVSDIIYNGKFQIFNPEFVLIREEKKQNNLANINQTILNGVYGIDEISSYDFRIKEEVEAVINGEIGVNILLNKIKELEENDFGNAKYLKHISNGYIK